MDRVAVATFVWASNMSESSETQSGTVREAQDRFIETWGRMGSAWGISRTMAEVHALLADSYAERLADLNIMASDDGTRAAAEFTVNGTYLKTDEGLPEARGQTYVLPAGTFFTIRDGKIARVTTYYNLSDWTAQVSA